MPSRPSFSHLLAPPPPPPPPSHRRLRRHHRMVGGRVRLCVRRVRRKRVHRYAPEAGLQQHNYNGKTTAQACWEGWAGGYAAAPPPPPPPSPAGYHNFFTSDVPANPGLFWATWLFGWAFASTSSTIVSGAMAERTKFRCASQRSTAQRTPGARLGTARASPGRGIALASCLLRRACLLCAVCISAFIHPVAAGSRSPLSPLLKVCRLLFDSHPTMCAGPTCCIRCASVPSFTRVWRTGCGAAAGG